MTNCIPGNPTLNMRDQKTENWKSEYWKKFVELTDNGFFPGKGKKWRNERAQGFRRNEGLLNEGLNSPRQFSHDRQINKEVVSKSLQWGCYRSTCDYGNVWLKHWSEVDGDWGSQMGRPYGDWVTQGDQSICVERRTLTNTLRNGKEGERVYFNYTGFKGKGFKRR